MISKSDFTLKPYVKRDNFRAIFQIVNTLGPYLLLWVAAVQLAKASIWFLPPVILLIVLFSLRCFSLMHDCGHNSLFSSRKANRIAGFVLGIVNAMPQHWWAKDHAYHHRTNGNWEEYRAIGDFLSVEEYSALSDFDKSFYRATRHPLMIFPGGFFYLAFKPRLILLLGGYDLVRYCIAQWRANPSARLSDLIASHPSKHWGAADEFYDILLSNVCVVSLWVVLCHFFGAGFFLGVYSIVLMLSAAAFICIFFVQHNFEGAYAHKTEGWSYLLGAVEGSSYLEMPAVLRWFTADISYHSIHHLSEGIPNYNLKACHQENAHLLTQAKVLQLKDIRHCANFILWDSAADRLVSIENYG